MAAIDDLQTSVANLVQEDQAFKNAVSQALTDLQEQVSTLQTQIQSGNDASIEQAATTIQSTVDDLTAVTAQATGADPGAQTPPPAPGT